MDVTQPTRTRGPNRAPKPGPSRAAGLLFDIYYCGPAGFDRRERVITKFAAKGGIDRRAALDKLGKYSRGDRVPEKGSTWRRILADVANIPQRSWDEAAAVAS